MKIVVERGGINKIAEEVGVNRRTVASALSGVTCTARAREIRELAVAKYGGMMVEHKSVAVTDL